MSKRCRIVALGGVLTLAIGCGQREGPQADHALRSVGIQEHPPAAGAIVSQPTCPPSRSEGTVAPAGSIYAITFAVNGREHVVREGDTLRVVPGDDVRVQDVTICVGPFSGDGGEACVDVAPVARGGREVISEHAGTHQVPLAPGLTTIPGPDASWTIRESWKEVAAVLNHWPPTETRDRTCAEGRCERDDRMVIVLQ
jgi:hypothetical protein